MKRWTEERNHRRKNPGRKKSWKKEIIEFEIRKVRIFARKKSRKLEIMEERYHGRKKSLRKDEMEDTNLGSKKSWRKEFEE